MKKAEGSLDQATREKQDLSHALAAEKRRALGKGGDARLGNLAQRVQILVRTCHMCMYVPPYKDYVWALASTTQWRFSCFQEDEWFNLMGLV